MPVTTTVVGSYPKPPDEGQQFAVRRALHAIERGEATSEDLLGAQDELARAVIGEQEDAGIDVVTDGLVRWDDIVTPFALKMSGFEIGGLLRFFDNNVYYRRPICTGPIVWEGPVTVEALEFAQKVARRPVKAVIPGPITFARLSVDEHYGDYKRYVMAIAAVLSQEAFELHSAGARVIQVDEPSLLHAPEDIELAGRALSIVTKDLEDTEVVLAGYFADAKRLGAGLFGLPVTGFGFDLVSGPENLELIKGAPSEARIQAGIVDARNTKLEPVDDLVVTIESLVETVGADRLWVCPSAGLEFLPREKARAKLRRLCEAVEEVGE
jgi:5-methyltetrahydropteroyltriglutamate--homocysteine methyltransferase